MGSLATYRDAVETKRDLDNGLVKTNQGGMAYQLDELAQVKRFLILGSEGNTLYEDQSKRTLRNVKVVQTALDTFETQVVDLIVEVSDRGLASNNDPALLALAMAASFKSDDPFKQARVRSAALEALPKVARTGTHLFHFVDFVDSMRGWGSGLRNAVADWYLDKSPMALANQITKYQQRDGWSHRDVLRKAHPNAKGSVKEIILGYAVNGALPNEDTKKESIGYLQAVERVKASQDVDEIVNLIATYDLPREVLPTLALNSPKVWDALLQGGRGMPIHAMMRNLGNLGKHGLLDPMSDGARYVMNRLVTTDFRTARLHPIDVIKAKLIYGSGSGMRGSGTWSVNRNIVDALEEAFYATFDAIEPTGKRGVLGIDVSGSMASGMVAGVQGFTPCMAASVMAMVTARVEREYVILGFSDGVVDLRINKNDSLETVMRKAYMGNWGGTNHAALFNYAKSKGFPSDYFIVYTDNETGYGDTKKAINQYRASSQIHDAKVITVGMIANQFSIADPSDRNMLDVVGFSTDAPAVMSEFIRGNI